MNSPQVFPPEVRMTAVDAEEKRAMRSILLHFEPATTNVDGFACCACDWFFVLTTSEPDGTLSRSEVDMAHVRFSEHSCKEYPKARNLEDTP